MGRSVYRSSNGVVLLPESSLAQPVTSVVYDGEASLGAVIVGRVDVDVTTPVGGIRVQFGIRVRRVPSQRLMLEQAESDLSVAGLHLAVAVMVQDLIPGDIIECVLGYDDPGQASLRARGFHVVVL